MKHNKINTASSFLPAPESWPGVFLDPVLGLGVAVAVVVSVVGGVVRHVVIGVAQSNRPESQLQRKSGSRRTCRRYFIFSIISSVYLTIRFM